MSATPPRARVSGIVLAGGRARRFGGQKLEVELDGRPLVEWALDSVAAVSDEVLVAGPGRIQERAGGGGLRVVPDVEAFPGPLVALSGALREARGELAIVVGGDMPGLVPDVLRAMLARLSIDGSVDAIILQAPVASADDAPRKLQVLPLAVRVEPARRAAAAALDAGGRSLASLLDRLRAVAVPADAWLPFDPDGLTLADVDEPADLDRLRGSGMGRTSA